MTGTLRRRNQELEARETSARALHRVSVAIASLTDIDRVLEAIVTHARELLGVDAVILLLAGPDGRLARRAASAIPGALLATPSTSGADPADDAEATAADQILHFVVASSAVARVAAPLQRGGTTIGLLAVGAPETRSFDADALETLSSLANQATIALENARLETRLRELAVVGERERIARELHDGLSQVLGYVNTKSQAVDGFLAAGRVDEARAQLGELSAAARSVYVDVRETILGLRSPIGPDAGLVAAIRAHAAGVAESAKLAIRGDRDPRRRSGAARSGRGDPGVPDRRGGADERPEACRRAARGDGPPIRGRPARRSRSATTAGGSQAEWSRRRAAALRAPLDVGARRGDRRDARSRERSGRGCRRAAGATAGAVRGATRRPAPAGAGPAPVTA